MTLEELLTEYYVRASQLRVIVDSTYVPQPIRAIAAQMLEGSAAALETILHDAQR